MGQNTDYFGADYANYFIANPNGPGYVNVGGNPLAGYSVSQAPAADWGARAAFSWILTPLAPSVAPSPAPPATFLQTSVSTIGATIMMAYGTGRLGGQLIWTTGLDANSDSAQTGLVTGMWSFCEPADPDEPIRIQKLWATGTLFYDYAVNPTAALSVANLTPDAQAALDACVASMVLHLGGPGELPDATMVSVLGEANVPAHRGLRTITFIDFPASISGNSMPTMSCLFRRTDTLLVRVDTAIKKIIDRYILRTGVDISFQTEGIDDLCYGATVSDQGTAIDLLTRHKETLNFQILDGDPIRIVRKAISSGLVIDLEIAEADIVRKNGAPTIPSSRVNPAQLPIGINFQYADPDADFDTRTQPAMHEGTAATTLVTSVSSIFSVDGSTARQTAFALLYRLRAKALRFPFELDNIETEVSDVIRMTTNEGDAYTLLVEEATYTKSRSTGVRALAMLTEAGADIDGGLGLDGGSRAKLYWPEEAVDYQMIPTATRIWSAMFDPMPNYNSNPPARKISGIKYTLLDHNYYFNQMFEDALYVYWVDSATISVWRCRKNATNIGTSLESLAIADFSGSYFSKDRAAFKDGKLYVLWSGPNGEDSEQFKLVIVDLEAWDSAAYTTHVFQTVAGSTITSVIDLHVTDNGTIVIATEYSSGGTQGKLFWATVAAPSTWATVNLSIPPDFLGTTSANWIYYTSGVRPSTGSPTFGTGIPNRTTDIIVIDCSSGTPVENAVIDLAGVDANIVCISQRGLPQDIFASPGHLFVPCNFTRSTLTAAFNPGNDGGSRSYLARLDHGTLADAGGKFLDEMVTGRDGSTIFNGKYFDGKLYVTCLDGTAGVVIVNEDLSPASATVYPPQSVATPENDDFDAALPLELDVSQSGNLTFATMESGEPIPDWAWDGVTTSPAPTGQAVYTWSKNQGHSVWYSFRAPSTTTYTVEVGYPANPGAAGHSIQVYTGTDVGALTEIASTPTGGAGPTSCSFSATAGEVYKVSIRHDGINGFADFSNMHGNPLPNDVDRQGRFTIVVTV